MPNSNALPVDGGDGWLVRGAADQEVVEPVVIMLEPEVLAMELKERAGFGGANRLDEADVRRVHLRAVELNEARHGPLVKFLYTSKRAILNTAEYGIP